MKSKEHFGHRERVKNKYLQIGIEKFHEHEIVELLLFFGIPFKDTNEIAHKLIRKFGNLAGVLDASVEDLCSISGMTKNAAVLLNLMPQLFREYKKCKVDKKKPIINVEDILPILEANLQCREMETLYVICINASQRISAIVETGVAELSSVLFSPRTIVDIALKYKAVNLIISHNHPSGRVYPSESDIALTVDLKHMLKSIDVELIDHIILTDDNAYSFFLKNEIQPYNDSNVKPYRMSKKNHDEMPKSSVINVRKKEDGSFEVLG